MLNKVEYVCNVTLTKIRGCNVLSPSSIHLTDKEVKRFVLDVMEPGDEVVIKKMTYEEFLASLPDKGVRE